MTDTDRIERARLLYEQAVFGGDPGALGHADQELDSVEADLALARGRVLHARFLAERQEDPRELVLFERAADLFQRLHDPRGEGEALFWVGTFHQVVRGDGVTAHPCFEKSYQLAESAGDKLTLSYAARHLGFGDVAAGRLDQARARFEESVRLRQEIGFIPGVAAGKLALAELAEQTGDHTAALTFLAEARQLAEDSGSKGISGWIEQTEAVWSEKS
jgi:tetratricopeptide (TPR) repeat protein